MRRVAAIVGSVGVVALAVGFLLLGALPPGPAPHPVHQLVAADKLAAPQR